MNEPPFAEVTTEALHSRKERFFLRKLPYVAVLLLTLFGVAYTSMAQQSLAGFWEILAAATGVLCITAAWPKAQSKQGRFQLIFRQSLHWAAILAAMNIVLLTSVQRMLTAPAAGLIILLLLALGTFLAGITTSFEIAFLGIAMALAVPAIAELDQSALFLFLAGAAVSGTCLALWRR
ncbi:MAG: hypothetical protein L0Y57_08105 [Beijerinckiaceae bacterium]|nr:hypothetical protein [Beijerinckiaceae bacterium]